jgi:hypothetical protein
VRRLTLLCHYGVSSGPELLAHYLDHYEGLGVERGRIFIIVHGIAGDIATELTLDVLRRRGMHPAARVETFSCPLKHARYRELVSKHCAADDWVIYADGDELQVYPARLPDFVEQLAVHGRDYATGAFVDRLAAGGALASIRPSPSLWDQFPLAASVTERLMGGWTRKVCVVLARRALSEGGAHALHFTGDRERDYARTHAQVVRSVEVHHFKWTESLPGRLHDKLVGARGDLDRVDGSEFMAEYERLAEHLRRHGRIDLAALDDVRWVGRPSAKGTEVPLP